MDAYYRYQNRQLLVLFNEYSPEEMQLILTEFEKHLGKSIYRDIYLRDGLTNVLIQDQLCLFLRQKKPALLSSLLSYESFCNCKT